MRISDWSSDVCSSDLLDWLVTVDPHLHRYHELSEIYRIPTQVVHAAPFLASWIKRNVARPLIIGPDLESEQWVSQRSEEHTSELQSLMRISYAVFCLTTQNTDRPNNQTNLPNNT